MCIFVNLTLIMIKDCLGVVFKKAVSMNHVFTVSVCDLAVYLKTVNDAGDVFIDLLQN